MAYYTATSTPADEDIASNMDYSGYPTPSGENSLPRKIHFASPSATPSAEGKHITRKSAPTTDTGDYAAIKYDGTIAQYMRNQLELNSNESATYAEHIETLLNTLEERTQILEAVQTELKSCKDENAHYKVELSQYMNNQLDLQNTEAQDFEEKFTMLTDEIDRKDITIEELRNTISVKDEENKLLVQKALIREVDFQTHENEFENKLRTMNDSFTTEISELKSKHEESVSELNWELKDLKNEVDILNEVIV